MPGLDGKRFDHFPCRGTHLRGRPQPRLPEDGSDLCLCVGMPGEDPYQLSTQPLEIGRQKNIGDAGACMRHELAGELCDEREIFVQAPGERLGMGLRGSLPTRSQGEFITECELPHTSRRSYWLSLLLE